MSDLGPPIKLQPYSASIEHYTEVGLLEEWAKRAWQRIEKLERRRIELHNRIVDQKQLLDAIPWDRLDTAYKVLESHPTVLNPREQEAFILFRKILALREQEEG